MTACLRPWAALLITAFTWGCGSSVVVAGEHMNGDEGGAPPDGPPGVDPPPPVVCGGSEAHIDVQIDGAVEMGCGYGSLSGQLTALTALPATDGLRWTMDLCPGSESCVCTIEVAGVGADLADLLAPFALVGHVVVTAGPHRLEVYQDAICPACVNCPCPAPLPLFYAAEGAPPLDEPSAAHPLVVEVVDQPCLETQDGCTTAAQRLAASAYHFDLNLGIAGEEPTHVSEPIAEGAAGPVGEGPVRLNVLRASGRSAGCQGATDQLAIGTAAWVVHGAYELW